MVMTMVVPGENLSMLLMCLRENTSKDFGMLLIIAIILVVTAIMVPWENPSMLFYVIALSRAAGV